MGAIGKSHPRIDAVGKVTGATRYPGDQNYDDELWMKILFARRPHARILSVDISQAESLPGVVAVLTAKDVPVNEYGLQIPDQPVLCGVVSGKQGADIVRFVGDQVALIIAESEKIAAQARDLIHVEYEDLPVLTDPRQAMAPASHCLHPHAPENVADRHRIVKGDVDSAWANCDVIIEGEYHTPFQEHAYLQPEAGSAYLDEQGRITVRVAGQWAWEDQQQIAHALDLPPERVRVVYDAIGGAFGGREDMSVQIVLALAVMRLAERGIQRPVKIIWTREESIIGHCKRHPMVIKSKWGATRDGKLVAAEVDLVSDAGAYMYTSNKVLGNATLTCTGPYEFPNLRVDTVAVYTNNPPGGAFRGFGAPQGHFAAEMQMNKLAEALGMSPVAVRLKNILDDEKLLSVGTPLPGGVSLKQVVEETAHAAGWQTTARPAGRSKPPALKGRGFAAGFKNVGFSFGYQENSWAKVALEGTAQIEQATLFIAGADVGQGHHTAMLQIAAEALDLSASRIALVVSDTAVTQSSGSASASRLTFLAGNAVMGAAERALACWREEERPAVAEYTYLAPQTMPIADVEGQPSTPNFAYGYVAQSVEVEVDTETGAIHVIRVVSADDVGRAINPQQVIGQIEGAVVQAQGYAMLENFQVEDGYILTPHLSTYLIPGVLDIPDQLDSIIVQHPDPRGPYGVRGMAEMPYLPLTPALIAAVHDATGVWFDDFPLTPERVLRGLGKI
ncbi:MAG: molybdopterin-dependent oxidoreductase [Anaerolineales bacterium]|nr:MAG: molybdopterin-dependent oxidoreductase [Anaerolineales bacterium]